MMKRFLLVAAILLAATSAHASDLHVGDTLKFNQPKVGCHDPRDRPHAAYPRNVSCSVLPSIEWKIVSQATSDGPGPSPGYHWQDSSDFCIIAAKPMNVGPPGSGPQTKEEIEAAEKEYCVWVRLNKQY
jgi:hypothetical protein